MVQGDPEPRYDQCSNASTTVESVEVETWKGHKETVRLPGGSSVEMTGKNVGDLLNERGVTWGWFQGGFEPTSHNASEGNRAICGQKMKNIGNAEPTSYVEHHEPFEYYKSTANLDHVAPSSVSEVGYSDPAETPMEDRVNHQYDLSWFNQAIEAGNMPQVSFLKAPAAENGHPGNSDPLDEQKFIVEEINKIQNSPYWKNTAIFINYDDSDGWYDHQIGPILFPSHTAADHLNPAPAQLRIHQRKREGRARQSLRPRPAYPADADLAVREIELRRQHAHRAVVDYAVRRAELEPRQHRCRLRGRRLGQRRQHVRIRQRPARAEGDHEPENR